ncbi:hypothetical protein BD413DRAFT_495814 [Trametes elegans]|nr:hypothetical protein BD413DRAFT_495814 [Trametes elegans]
MPGLHSYEAANRHERGSREDAMIAEEMARAMQRKPSTESHGGASQANAESIPDAAPDPKIQARKPGILKLPPELLLYIFRIAIPPRHQHDPSILHGPRSGWISGLRTRKALVLTCKTFHGPATEVLYEDIVLRRMGQIPALARTLDPTRTPSASGVAPLVRSIRMDSCVVWAPYADVVREDLRSIVQHCTALKAFSFHPHMNFTAHVDRNDDSFDGFDPRWLCSTDPGLNPDTGLLHSALTRSLSSLDLVLDVFDTDDFVAFHALLGAAPHLTKLRFELEDAMKLAPPDFGPVRHLSQLQDLEYCHTVSDRGWFMDYVCTTWSMPRLTALTLIEPGDARAAHFLRRHGAHLTYLHWRNACLEDEHSYALLDGLAAHCPRLEHLVLQRRATVLPTVRSPTLRFFDFWAAHEAPPPLEARMGAFGPGSETPALERVRVLAGPPLHFSLYPPTVDWPRLCRPLDVSGDEQVIWRFPALRVVQTAWGVFFEDALFFYSHDLLNVVTPGPDMEPGETYEEEEGGDTTSGSSDDSFETETSSLAGAGEEDEGVIEAVDRDALLDMFHDSQGRAVLVDDDDES